MKAATDYWKDWWDNEAARAGSDYTLNRGTTLRLEELEQRSLRQFIAAVNPQPEDVVLDAGCGSGRNISILSPLVKEVVAIDYSPQMVQRAEERVAAEKFSNVKLMTGDVTSLQFPADSFDKVVCASVLQYLDDDACALALHEMVRVCKSGGTLVLHVKNGASLYGLSLKILRPIARLMGRKMKPEHYRSRSWHERTLEKDGGIRADYDGFGILTFVPLPQKIVGFLLRSEMRVGVPKSLKKFAVNYKLTVRVNKS